VKDDSRENERGVSVLIADDDDGLRTSLGSAFEPMGFNVYLAPGGSIAVRLARERVIDVAILDINMPDLSGIEAMRRIRRARRSVGCIFITSDTSSSVRERAALAGDYTIVRKPIALERLRRAVMDVLGIRGIGILRGGDAHR
jgi:DNA-binding response OmpR family regulator